MESKNFSIKEALDFGWRKTKENLGFLIELNSFSFVLVFGVFLFLIFGFSIVSQIIGEPWISFLFLGLIITEVFWILFLCLGFVKIYLNFYDGIENKLSFLFSQKKAFPKFLLASLLIGVIVDFCNNLGFVLFFLINNWVGKIFSLFLIIFTILYFFVRLQFFPYFIVDKDSGPLESLKNSWNLTKGVVGKIFLLDLTLILINTLGILFFLVGSLVTTPVSGLALAFVYRKLSGQHELPLNTLPLTFSSKIFPKVIMRRIILFPLFLILILFLWAPWMDNQAIHDKVFQQKAHKDGTMDWVIYPDGTRKYELICDYKVKWFPFGRWVVSCEGGYFVTFFGMILF